VISVINIITNLTSCQQLLREFQVRIFHLLNLRYLNLKTMKFLPIVVLFPCLHTHSV